MREDTIALSVVMALAIILAALMIMASWDIYYESQDCRPTGQVAEVQTPPTGRPEAIPYGILREWECEDGKKFWR
jgi:hypothetical protein